jgi:hypothetical protein
MGRINVEGLGVVEIAGDEPTAEEISIITDNFKTIQAEKDTDTFVKGPNFGRIALEIGLGVAGSFATGGLGLPALAARAGMLARPFLIQLAKSSAGSAFGGGTGAGIAQTFDPKEDIVKEIGRAAFEAAAGEAVGTPIGIKVVNKLTSVLSPKISQLVAAADAEDILKSQKAKILANPDLYDKEIIEAAGKAIITPALKTDNQLIDISQNIVEKSLFGAKEILVPKQAAKRVTESALNDFVNPLINNTDATQTGRLFIDALVDSKELFKAQSKTAYGLLDQEVAKLGNTKVVDITKYNQALQEKLNRLPKGGVNTPSAKALLENNIYKDKDGNFINKITFSEANDLRSDILTLGRNLSATDSAKYIGAQKLISKELTTSIDKAVVPNTLKNTYLKANNFYKEGLTNYNDKIIEKILSKEDGKDAFKVIISGADKGETVEATLKSIDKIFKNNPSKAKDLKDALKGTVLDDMMKKSYFDNGQYGPTFSADKMNKYIESKTETFEKLFGKDSRELGQLKKLNTAVSVAHGRLSREGGLPGGVFIQLTQAGTAGGLLTFNQDATGLTAAAGILLGPKVIGKMLVNPKFNKFLFEGLAANDGTKAGIAFRQLVGRMVTDKLIPETEGKKAIDDSKKIEKKFKTTIPPADITPKQPSTSPMAPVNTRVTDIQTRPMAAPMQETMPTGGLRERISQSNQLDQFIPVR